jgi:hypothetical protein
MNFPVKFELFPRLVSRCFSAPSIPPFFRFCMALSRSGQASTKNVQRLLLLAEQHQLLSSGALRAGPVFVFIRRFFFARASF